MAISDARETFPVSDLPRKRGRLSQSAARERPSFTLNLHTNLGEIEQEWRSLEERAFYTPFQTYCWLSKWQYHIGQRNKVVPVVISCCNADGELVALIPLAVERRWGITSLTWLGSELCDYNAPLLTDSFISALGPHGFHGLWREILFRLRNEWGFHFDIVDLPKNPELVEGQVNPFFSLPTIPNPNSAHLATLGPSWDEYYVSKRSGKTRRTERRKTKLLSKLGELQFVSVTDHAGIHATFEELFIQKERAFRRMGAKNIFAAPECHKFFEDVASDPEYEGLAHLSKLQIGDKIGAVSFGLRSNSRFSLVLSSYDDGEFSRFGPGRIHLYNLLRHAIETETKIFDFTIGDEPYKRAWSDIEAKLHDHVASYSIRGFFAAKAIIGFRRTKRFVKRTTYLRKSFMRVRELIGAPIRRERSHETRTPKTSSHCKE